MKNFKSSMTNKKAGLTQKSDIYYDAYTHMFAGYDVLDKLTILEIGVRDGGGLYTLKEHFPNSTIIGLDIDPGCKRWEDIPNDVFVKIGDQSDNDVLNNLISEFPNFDIIIDDGSHICSHQIKSFEFLFPYLNKNGLYVVEDLHTSYWEGYTTNLDPPAINYFTNLSVIPTERWARNTTRSKVTPIHDLNEIQKSISSVHFYDSICFINKTKSDIDLGALVTDYKQFFITQ